MPPPITTTSKCLPAISSMARARVSIKDPGDGTISVHIGPFSSRRPPSVEVGGGLVGAGALGGRLRLARVAEVEEADEALLLGEVDGGAALGAAEDAGGAPVAGEAVGVGGEQDDVGGG